MSAVGQLALFYISSSKSKRKAPMWDMSVLVAQEKEQWRSHVMAFKMFVWSHHTSLSLMLHWAKQVTLRSLMSMRWESTLLTHVETILIPHRRRQDA